MNKRERRIVYESKLYDVAETIEILKKCPPDIFFKLYHKYRKELDSSMGKSKKDKITLEQVVIMMNNGFKRLDNKMDTVNTRLDNLEVSIDRIDTRLSYIVKANNLKDIK